MKLYLQEKLTGSSGQYVVVGGNGELTASSSLGTYPFPMLRIYGESTTTFSTIKCNGRTKTITPTRADDLNCWVLILDEFGDWEITTSLSTENIFINENKLYELTLPLPANYYNFIISHQGQPKSGTLPTTISATVASYVEIDGIKYYYPEEMILEEGTEIKIYGKSGFNKYKGTTAQALYYTGRVSCDGTTSSLLNEYTLLKTITLDKSIKVALVIDTVYQDNFTEDIEIIEI